MPPRDLHLPIAAPCHEDWDGMSGGGVQRFCGVCEKHVTNLSELTRGQAAAFLRDHAGGRVCVRYRRDPAGEIKFVAPSVSAPAPTAMHGFRATLAAAGLAAMLSGCTSARLPDRVDADGCTYSVGPFEFRLKRGEGKCPADADAFPVMGAVAPPPEVEMGKIAVEEVEVMGEAPIAAPPLPPPAPPVRERELMGDVAAPGPAELQGLVAPEPEPCAGKPPTQ